MREEEGGAFSLNESGSDTQAQSTPESRTKYKACSQIITLFLVVLLYYYNLKVEMKQAYVIHTVDQI